jgi:hypothetical protein
MIANPLGETESRDVMAANSAAQWTTVAKQRFGIGRLTAAHVA